MLDAAKLARRSRGRDVYHKYLRDLNGGHAVYRPAVWAIHPYTDVIAFERSVQRHRPLPALRDTLVGRFAQQLRRVGFGSHTAIWLDEVSSFRPAFHATWAGPSVGFLAWTVGLSMTAFKDNAFRSCRSNWTDPTGSGDTVTLRQARHC